MNMNWEKSIRIGFVIVSLSFLWSLIRLDSMRFKVSQKDKELSKVILQKDSLQNLSDSLSSELFPKEIELGRYEVAFRIFMERNPKASSQYADIISEETE